MISLILSTLLFSPLFVSGASVATSDSKNSNQGSKYCYILDSHDNDRYKNISLLGLAAYNDDLKTFKLLLDAGCDLHYNDTATMFYYMPGQAPDDLIEAAIEEYGEDYYEDNEPLMGWMDGATMLHICAMEGSLEVMEYLLSLPEVDVNAMDGFMETPAFFAAYWGWYEMFPMLTAAGADLELKSSQLGPPIYAAAYFGYDYTVEALIEAGANPDATDDTYGETALIVAAQFGYREVARVLIEGGADLNLRDDDGYTALFWAQEYNYRRIAKMLKKHGATL